MGLKIAVANGNWSNPATWNGGLLPNVGDVIASNNFTVTIDQNVNVSLLTNTVQSGVSVVPVMTSATTPSGIVTSSSNYDAARAAWNAFASSGMWISTNNPVMPQWIAYEFTSAKIIDTYSFTNGWSLAAMPKDFVFQGWNGSSWVTLHTVTGNTSSTYTSPSIGNTTAYIAYRFSITLINQTNPNGDQFVSMAAIKMFELGDFTGSSVAGGGFILNGGITIDSINEVGKGIINGNTTCITFSASGTSVINGRITNASSVSSINTIVFSGNGTLTINGNFATADSSSRNNVLVSGNGTLNITGNLSHATNSQNILISGLSTNNPIINVVGTFSTGGSGSAANIFASSACTINITGNLPTGVNSGRCVTISSSSSVTLNITGNLVGLGGNGNAVSIGGGVHYINITGNISGNPNQSTFPTFSSGVAHYFSHIGQQIGADGGLAVSASSSSAINLFSGPFISSPYGFVPFQCVRMHLIPNAASYFEFRDETTNGALSPGAIAPATQLVSPASVSDGPAVNNVRFGTTYALGTLTGTLRMPHPNQVTYGVAVDNTFGAAVLTAASVWDYLVSNITVENSIGMRLKNVSTPQTTGEQLEAFLRLD